MRASNRIGAGHLTRRSILLGATGSALVMSARAEVVRPLVFGLVTGSDPERLRPKWRPFLDDMAKGVGTAVEPFYAENESRLVDAIGKGRVHVAWLSNLGAIEAVDHAGAEVFARRSNPDTSTGYRPILVANKTSPLRTLEDVLAAPDGMLAYRDGEPDSVGSFLAPRYFAWLRNRVDLGRHFRRVVSGDEATNLQAIANGADDVAASTTESWERFRDDHPDRAVLVRRIWAGPLVPTDPILQRTDLDPAQARAIRQFFLDYGASREGASGTDELKVLWDLGHWYRFVPSNNRQLVIYRQFALLRERLKVEADPQTSAADRDIRLRTIDAQLRQFDRELGQAG